jgi:formamidopyrimidine-DNA glycosylase
LPILQSEKRGQKQNDCISGVKEVPELPEVEQVRLSLERHMIGKKIEKVEIYVPKMVKHPDLEAFCQGACGQTIVSVGRTGKYLRVNLQSGDYLLIHLRMTGALLAVPKGSEKPPFTRWGMMLSGNEDLWMSDIRKFGTVGLYRPGDAPDPGYAALGPEPLSEALTADYLRAKADGKTCHLKSFILDQSVIAGLGNIYADEALFEAGLRPQKRVNRMRKKDWPVLVEAINRVIAQGLRHHGTTFRNYQDADGHMGDNLFYLNVYHRKGEPCKRCGTLLKQIKVGGRGSVFCSNCQK